MSSFNNMKLLDGILTIQAKNLESAIAVLLGVRKAFDNIQIRNMLYKKNKSSLAMFHGLKVYYFSYST